MRAARAANPERALEYTHWPSRAGLTLKVITGFLLSLFAALALSFWIEFGGLLSGGKDGAGPRILV